MGTETAIAWTDHTFNPWWGCQRVSPGCTNCYAEAWDKFRGGPEKHWGPVAPRRFFGDAHWNEPLKWERAAAAAGVRARVFCSSMADVFEDRRDLDEQRERLWDLIAKTPNLDWQILTKRPENMVRLAPPIWASGWPSNVWAGTTVEDQQRTERIEHLKRTPAAVRFLSVEPLLGPVDLAEHLRCPRDYNRDGDCDRHPKGCPHIGWVIVGGESGPGARPMEIERARSILAQCKAAGVPAFFKQTGSAFAKANNLVDTKGGILDELAPDLHIREFPEVSRG